MGYTIRDFIESNKFPVIQLISDNSEMNREIKGVHMIVVPNSVQILFGDFRSERVINRIRFYNPGKCDFGYII